MIEMIVAMDLDNGIGKDGKMPWDCPEDREFFHKMVKGKNVVVGRKTFETIKPYFEQWDIEDIFVFSKRKNTTIEAIGSLFPDLMVIGGGEIYKEFLPYTDVIYRTVINGRYNCDTFFPDDEARKYFKGGKILLRNERCLIVKFKRNVLTS